MAENAVTNEDRRLAALRRETLLDSGAEPGFDAIVRTAARACGTPIAHFNLVDADRVWSKAAVGQQQGGSTPREGAPCAYAIQHPGTRLEVGDARADRRFAALPQVASAAGWRFYAGVPVRADGGEPIGTLCVMDRAPRGLADAQRAILRDLALALEALVAERRRRRDAVRVIAERDETSPAALLVVDPSGTVESVSGRWLAQFGHARDELRGAPLSRFVAALARDGFAREWRAIVGSKAPDDAEIATRLTGRDGEIHEVRVCVRADRDAGGDVQRLRCAFVDVTAERAALNALGLHERTDPLTGALNRSAFVERALGESMRAQRHARPLSLVLFDPDHLRALNEGLGLAGGDEALARVVAAGHEDLRVTDAIGRVSGGQFGILLPETPAAGAMHVAERLRSRVQAMAFGPAGARLRLTLACGIASFEPGASVAQVLARAHAALRAAKAGGGNRTVIDEGRGSATRRIRGTAQEAGSFAADRDPGAGYPDASATGRARPDGSQAEIPFGV